MGHAFELVSEVNIQSPCKYQNDNAKSGDVICYNIILYLNILYINCTRCSTKNYPQKVHANQLSNFGNW